MKDLFYMGGPLYMGILTVILIAMIAWAVYHYLPVVLKNEVDFTLVKARLKHVKTIGTFGLVIGILGQLVGFYGIFEGVEQAGDVPPALLMGGLKVSMITTFYGIFIFLLGLLIWFVCDFILTKKSV